MNEATMLLVDDDRAEELKQASLGFKSITLSKRQLCDLELLMNGGFSPLTGFMGQAEYDAVLDTMKLPDGRLWPMPITLDVPAEFADGIEPGEQIALRDAEGFMPAVLTVEEIWQPDKAREAIAVYGTDSDRHPGVRHLLEQVQGTYLSGRLEGVQLPVHYEFETLWDTPEEMRSLFRKMGWNQVLAFHSSNPIHRLHRELILSSAKEHGCHILLHPAVGVTKPGDLHYYARVHCYKAIRHHFPHNLSALSLLPLAMRMAGPREALWHAIVNRNYGCSHFLVGPDHASPPLNGSDTRHYATYQAQELALKHQDDLGIRIVPAEEWRYAPSKKRFLPVSQLRKSGIEGESFSNSQLKQALTCNQEIPDWFSYPNVIQELSRAYPSRATQGFTLFFTGLSGSGKSTIAGILYAKLIESGSRPVTLLDGDIVRQNLSSELGFSKRDRDINIRRIGFVASEITKNGGVAICAPIAPYTETRRAVRELIEQHGAFIEIHVSTPLEVCEARDRKGLYAKARKGIIPEFTGISDPYEAPEHPEIDIDTSDLTPAQAAQMVLLYLFKEGYLDERE
ncbi:MAG TPA: bifunctional sulfate adenylyltransferase/adenylylsulfate kinase [Sedimenticola thiotaurini]|uniref:Adenylyl-sulfate kinase n=1 Tax=Sedimenticola thiotaurini TaxID=1543721 RepID=A0A831RNS3_9GAMM|nr:bifunctional sulfate adenylyltransferase/adenylylsulfate kinase [Sedimenticola thiotaurini]